MFKPIIAIDIDDVLANSTDALRRVVNKRLRVDLLPEHYKIPGDYWNHYETVWQVHGLEDKISLADIEPMMVKNQNHVLPHNDAYRTLKKLSKQYELIIVTSRPPSWRSATERWLGDNFPGLFDKILFTRGDEDSGHKSKGLLCAEHKASWLIDDNVQHAQSALDEGIDVVLFGDYGWHHKVPKHIYRCKDWSEVLRYFNGKN